MSPRRTVNLNPRSSRCHARNTVVRHAVRSAGEVLRGDAVEELAEAFELGLFFLGGGDAGFAEDLFGAADRRTEPDREGDRSLGRAETRAPLAEHEFGVEDGVAQFDDLDRLDV